MYVIIKICFIEIIFVGSLIKWFVFFGCVIRFVERKVLWLGVVSRCICNFYIVYMDEWYDFIFCFRLEIVEVYEFWIFCFSVVGIIF